MSGSRKIWVRKSVRVAGATAGLDHLGVAIEAGRGQALEVLREQLVLLRAQAIEVVPGEQAGVVAVGERRLDGVVAHRVDLGDEDVALAGLQRLLPRAVALHLGRRR